MAIETRGFDVERELLNFYPEEPFPGVPAYRPSLSYIDQADMLSKEDEGVLVGLVERVDRFLALKSLLLDINAESTSNTSEFFTRLVDPKTTSMSIYHAVDTVNTEARTHQDMELVFPLAGAIPLARMVYFGGIPKERLHMVEISGSIGTQTGEAAVRDNLPKSVLDPQKEVLIVEDLTDSMGTVVALVQARRKERERLGIPIPGVTEISNIKERLKNAKENGIQWEVFRDLSLLCEQEHILIMPVFNKNIYALGAIKERAMTGESRWAHIQSELFTRYAVRDIPDVWVLGAGLLDTCIAIERTVKYLPENIRSDPRLLNWVLKDIKVRIGAGIPGLVYLTGNQEEKLVQLVANEIEKILTA